jgi:hypothetical protein
VQGRRRRCGPILVRTQRPPLHRAATVR